MSELVAVFQTGNPIALALAKGALELQGIAFVTQGEGPHAKQAEAHKDVETALRQAGDDDRLGLLEFGANRCLDCIILSHLFEDKTVRSYLQDNFHVVQIDVGNWDRNLDVSRKYGSPIDNGIPAVVILAASGDVIASTKNGALADARTATAREVLDYLKRWAALKPTHASH